MPKDKVLVSLMFIPNTWLVGSQYLFNTWMQICINEGESYRYFLKTAQGLTENMQYILDKINKNRCKQL